MTNLGQIETSLEAVTTAINSNDIVVFAKAPCPFCKKLFDLLTAEGLKFSYSNIDVYDNAGSVQNILFSVSGQRTVPSVFLYGTHVGGFSDLKATFDKGQFGVLVKNCEAIKNLKAQKEHSFDYDMVVIGGGSGGLACAKEVIRHTPKVAIFDFVKPSPQGSTWGLGGTCVNVGCIPKKLMHQSALVGETIKHSADYGWELPTEKVTHNWGTIVGNIQSHIKGLNFSYRTLMKQLGIEYIRSYAKVAGPHTVIGTDAKGKETAYTAKFIIIATGERPTYPDIPGAKEFGISSDDVFSLKYNPGKVLVVGASYVALECAGALHGMGFDVTVMVRSILLRGFDTQAANLIGVHMKQMGIKFIEKAVPTKVEQLKPVDIKARLPGSLNVSYKLESQSEPLTEEFNTILFAIGRESNLHTLGLTEAGVKLDSRHHIIGLHNTEMTEVPSIFGIGDILTGKPQLTPMAIKSGILLGKRLFTDDNFDQCDYTNVATTVFTPLEYGAIGMSEEQAISVYGEDGIDVYHDFVNHLESTMHHHITPDAYYAKLICVPRLNNRVVGLHVLAPNAGEITQGFAIGFRMNATYKDFQSIVGIHPTSAEIFTNLVKSKKSKQPLVAGGC